MAKYDGLSAKELRARLLYADKGSNGLKKYVEELQLELSEKERQIVALGAAIDMARQESERLLKIEETRTSHASNKVHALSHDLEYERARRISAENARFDLEQRLHGLSNTHVEVPAIREIMPGLRIDRNGDIA